MDFTAFGLAQTCTLWSVTGIDYSNQPTFAVPVQIICRWEDRQEKVMGEDGTQLLSRATVFLAQDVGVGDFVALGTVAGADPRTIPSAFRVLAFNKVPGIYAEMFERRAYL